MRASLPPLPAERHACAECRTTYDDVTVADAIEAVASAPLRIRDAAQAVPVLQWAARPRAGGWSVAEYICHLRDVYITYTVRLHRARTEDRPILEPMLNDLRARRFRYDTWNVAAVLDEIDATAAGCCAEAARTTDWDRVVTRLPDEERTARWLLRQVMHEGTHHVADLRRVGAAVADDP